MLAGSALFEYLFFDVYSAALYLPREKDVDALGPETPRVLVIYYHRAIDRTDIIKAADEILGRQLPEELPKLQERLKTLNSVYKSVNPGDRYSLSYDPREGTSLALNGETLVTIPGSDFAQAYFGIWLGASKPLSEDLRERLLTGRTGAIP